MNLDYPLRLLYGFQTEVMTLIELAVTRCKGGRNRRRTSGSFAAGSGRGRNYGSSKCHPSGRAGVAPVDVRPAGSGTMAVAAVSRLQWLCTAVPSTYRSKRVHMC